MSLTAQDIAAHLDGVVVGDPSLSLFGFASADKAKAGDLTFAENETYFRRAEDSQASAILVEADFPAPRKTLIRVKSARVAFARVLPLFFPERRPPPGIHPTSVVAASARIDPSCHIGPFSVIGEDVAIGPGSILAGGNHVGASSMIGEDCHLFPNVTLYERTVIGHRVRIHAGSVLGADGFGYVFDEGVHRKIPQAGTVVVGDDVEIGANVTIDRGALGPTSIGKGSKIDNLVQIAHNVVVGEHSLIIAQVGVAGSTKLGSHVTLGGQVGLAGHLKIGNGATVAAQSGVMHDIPDGEKWLGSPARADRQMKRQILALQQLPDLLRRLAHLERQAAASRVKAGVSKAQADLPID